MFEKLRQVFKAVQQVQECLDAVKTLNAKVDALLLLQREREQSGKARKRKTVLTEEQRAVLLDDSLTYRVKAERLGMSPAWVSNQLKRLRQIEGG